MTTTETPAAQLRAAAARLRELANGATPGPWKHMCLGSEGCLVIREHGTIRERGRGRVAKFGLNDWQADHAERPVRGRDGPGVRPGCRWLAGHRGREGGRDGGYEDSDAYPLMVAGFRHSLAVARAYLGEAERAVRAQLGETDE